MVRVPRGDDCSFMALGAKERDDAPHHGGHPVHLGGVRVRHDSYAHESDDAGGGSSRGDDHATPV